MMHPTLNRRFSRERAGHLHGPRRVWGYDYRDFGRNEVTLIIPGTPWWLHSVHFEAIKVRPTVLSIAGFFVGTGGGVALASLMTSAAAAAVVVALVTLLGALVGHATARVLATRHRRRVGLAARVPLVLNVRPGEDGHSARVVELIDQLDAVTHVWLAGDLDEHRYLLMLLTVSEAVRADAGPSRNFTHSIARKDIDHALTLTEG